MRGRRALDVIIPARSEAALLPRCLEALLLDANGLDLKVIVVANGPDRASTTAAAAPFGHLFRDQGHELVLLETPVAGKANALNMGDREARGGCVAYLDADAVILPGSLPSMLETLSDASPLLACPRLHVVRSDDFIARHFGEVWRHTPAVTHGVIGAGCYAVNAAGRRRWTVFPEISGDDAFVCSLFSDAERRHLERGGFFFVLPDGSGVFGMRRRWRRSKLELQAFQAGTVAAKPPSTSGAVRAAAAIISKPRLWLSTPIFALVSLVARVSEHRPRRWRLGRSSALSSWTPVRAATMEPAADQGPVSVRVVIVTYNSADDIAACLASLRSSWASLDITVIDNGSSDRTVEIVRQVRPDARVIENRGNPGFAAAANQGAEDMGHSAFILLVNPDAVLDAEAIDALLALAIRFPEAGLYGGRMRDEFGDLDPTSCLARPSLWQAAAFALGLGRLRWLAIADPDSLGGWDRTGARSVPALTGAVLLIRSGAWRRAGGFDCRYFLYGEDVDLSLRATALGARPMFTDLATYAHMGGRSSAGQEDRKRKILTGKCTLYRTHLGPVWGALACHVLSLGAGLRALWEWARPAADGAWGGIWRSRASWRRGWACSKAQEAPALQSIDLEFD